MNAWKLTYKVFRSICVAAIIFVAALYVSLYMLISIPSIQTELKKIAQKELTKLFGATVEINGISISPFNELTIDGVSIDTPTGEKCVSIDKVGAGINLWSLLRKNKIDVTYAQIYGLDGHIWKQTPDSALNIQFLIDPFKSKKPRSQSKINLVIRNIIIRNSELSYDLRWMPVHHNRFDASHIKLTNLNADMELSELTDTLISINLRRLAFDEKSGVKVKKLATQFQKKDGVLSFSHNNIELHKSSFELSDIKLPLAAFKNIRKYLTDNETKIAIDGERVSISDFAPFYSKLEKFDTPIRLHAELEGKLNRINIKRLDVSTLNSQNGLSLSAKVENVEHIRESSISASMFRLKADREFINDIARQYPSIPAGVNKIIADVGNIDIDAALNLNLKNRNGALKGDVKCDLGNVSCDASAALNHGIFQVKGKIASSNLLIGKIAGDNNIGAGAFDADCDLQIGKGIPDGIADLRIARIEYKGNSIKDINVKLEKSNNKSHAIINIDDKILAMATTADLYMDGPNSTLFLDADIRHFIPAYLGLAKGSDRIVCGAKVTAQLQGNTPDNVEGTIDIDRLDLNRNGKALNLSNILLSIYDANNERNVSLRSDYVNGDLTGTFKWGTLGLTGKKLLSAAIPSFVAAPLGWTPTDDSANCRISINPEEPFSDFFGIPLHPAAKIDITGYIDSNSGMAEAKINAPYLIQGSSKLVKNTVAELKCNALGGVSGQIRSSVPMKDDVVEIVLNTTALKDRLTLTSDWKFAHRPDIFGNIDLSSYISRNPYTGKFEMMGYVMPAKFHLNGADWNISRATVSYADNVLNVHNLKFWHDDQFLNINGKASNNPSDILHVTLADMDLSYIFGTLNINYVDFGGIATGEIRASNVFTKLPLLRTDLLYVKNFSYNKAVVGDAKLMSYWDNKEQMVSISADINNRKRQRSLIKGGIYVTKDSLSFDFDANHLNMGLLKPFLSTFASNVGGEASGQIKLYGTFRDINLAGRAHADSLFLKVGFTEVEYHCADSVFFTEEKIIVPKTIVYDKFGHQARFEGEVTHNNFRNARFDFKLSDAKNLLCFDTNRKKHSNFYGRVFASGNGTLQGNPQYVSLMLDLTTSSSSQFTFALNDVKTAEEYSFLSFNDKTPKEEIELTEDLIFESKLKENARKKYEEQGSLFKLDLRCSLTPDIQINLLMDRKTGDGITARGNGPMTIMYNSDSNDVNMYGKYTLAEGNYKFSLQDIILRDFKINPGSNITFNGDPMQGILDIVASYRVNANLSEIDQSFATDKELSRTSVPVDALLNVKGGITAPEISFDIALPTLTQEVERKVRSIISTDDMMNRQIIYLLALNKFYTPEYMGNINTGNSDLASVASSTISGQLSSFLGQLTDKLSVAPSFRTDKGDFSDMEVDVALSSRLLNNRLLINGNFGYRDPSTSQTTFIGDFDIEYLLNRNGNLRLKAYNHFNDQYYYLRSAKTTQGLGVVFRRDFDNIANFLNSQKEKFSNIFKYRPERKTKATSDSVVNSGVYYDEFY